jgi:hypothetical protein
MTFVNRRSASDQEVFDLFVDRSNDICYILNWKHV